MKIPQSGVTLMELLLVMAIGGSILALGLNQYQIYKRDTDAFVVKQNVDLLFKAMSEYYQAQCYGMTDPTTITYPATGVLPASKAGVVLTVGVLNNTGSSTGSYVINNITTVLQGYLRGRIIPTPSLVDNTDYTAPRLTKGYSAIYVKAAGTQFTTAQVSVRLVASYDTASERNAALALLGGDCLSTSTGGAIYPCSANRTGIYVVWERPPSLDMDYDTWQSMILVKQFTRMYRPTTICRY